LEQPAGSHTLAAAAQRQRFDIPQFSLHDGAMSQPRVIAAVQARLGSTRLPQKVLRPLAGLPMVLQIARRLRAVPELTAITITIPDAGNERLARACRAWGYPIVEGPEEHIGERLRRCAFGADAVVRITADCPLVSPRVVSACVRAWSAAPGDYTSNVFPDRTFPVGLDCEVIARSCLDRLGPDGTAGIWTRPEGLTIQSVELVNVRLNALRWTVDTLEEFVGAQIVYDRLPWGFDIEDMLAEFGTVSLTELARCGPDARAASRGDARTIAATLEVLARNVHTHGAGGIAAGGSR
jgi:spore coat polysaccharide biosynthesis protein SpsF (cytidylyltransferase family)